MYVNIYELTRVIEDTRESHQDWELEAIKHGVEVTHESAHDEDLGKITRLHFTPSMSLAMV